MSDSDKGFEALSKAIGVSSAFLLARGTGSEQERIANVLKVLTARERELIKLRYGLGDGCTYTEKECALIFKTTREEVRKKESEALMKIRDSQPYMRLVPVEEQQASEL